MTDLTILLSSLVGTPLALLAGPVLFALWVAKPSEERLVLANDTWRLSRVALAQREGLA